MNNKLNFSAGILNIVVGAVLFVDTVVIAIFAFVCLLMSFSLFFMAAIPAFLVTAFLCFVAFVATVANTATGIGSVLTAIKGGKLSKIFSIISIVVDALVIPANAFALACGIYLLLSGEPDGLSVIIVLIAVCAIIFAVASLTVQAVSLTRANKAAVAEGSKQQ